MPTDRNFLTKRNYKPSELAATIRAIQNYINTATPVSSLSLYNTENELVLTLAGRGYIAGSTLVLNDIAAPVELVTNQDDI